MEMVKLAVSFPISVHELSFEAFVGHSPLCEIVRNVGTSYTSLTLETILVYASLITATIFIESSARITKNPSVALANVW